MAGAPPDLKRRSRLKLISLLFSFQKAKLFQYFKRLMEYPFHKPFFTDSCQGASPGPLFEFLFFTAA
jgi:hypothetical protein